MSGIYIPGAKIPDGDYVRVLMLHKDGTCVDGIGNVFKVVPVPLHGDLIDRDAAAEKIWDDMRFPSNLANAQFFVNELREMSTIIPAEEVKES